MAIVTAADLTKYSNLSASAATIAIDLIPSIQDRVCIICNNYFTSSDLYLESEVTFNATARTIIADGEDYDSVNLLAGEDVLISGSYRNDGVFTLSSVSGSTLTVISSQSVVDELSGASVLISLIKWPAPVKQAACQMIAYDYDVRPKQSANLKSHSLGPFSENFTTGSENPYGYPDTIMQMLTPYRMARIY